MVLSNTKIDLNVEIQIRKPPSFIYANNKINFPCMFKIKGENSGVSIDVTAKLYFTVKNANVGEKFKHFDFNLPVHNFNYDPVSHTFDQVFDKGSFIIVIRVDVYDKTNSSLVFGSAWDTINLTAK